MYPPQMYAEAAAERQQTLLARAAERDAPLIPWPIASASRRLVGRALIALGSRVAGPSPVPSASPAADTAASTA